MSWTISSQSSGLDSLLLQESLFFTGNGFLGVRGNLEEGMNDKSKTIRGTYLNGFHDIIDIPYGEKLYAFPETQQKLLNIIDTQTVEIWIGEKENAEMFSLWTGEVISYERFLHVDKGYSERNIHWKSSQGYELMINFKRLVSFTTKELFNQYITITPISPNIPIKIVTILDGNVENFSDPSDPRVASGDAKRLHVKKATLIEEASYVELETYTSDLRTAALAVATVSDPQAIYQYDVLQDSVVTTISTVLSEEIVFEKRTYFSDTRHGDHLQTKLIAVKDRLATTHYSNISEAQINYLDSFWKHADITIGGMSGLQEGIRFNLFHLLQSAGQDGLSSVSAKGLSGEGYEGHYFWDTEIYLLPMFTMTNPLLAKKLLLYRYSILEHAKARAKEMGHKQGALFPWRTISGQECSSFFPAGTAQYHISADIAHSFIQYFLATNDTEFIADAGAEVLIETARLWIDVGHFYQGQFRIDAVTGPDEYTCVVNNNYYTNVMAKQNLKWAVNAAKSLQDQYPEKWLLLQERIALDEEELVIFNRAAENMYLPTDEELKINPQDDSFLQKELWNFKETPIENYPLLLHYHPLTLYRYQVCKQADTVLAHFLLEDEQSEEIMKNSYDYYEKVTTHDSSLSSCIFSIMGARVGYVDKAYDYFIETARLDLDNTHGNTKDGLHMANMGGTWLAIVAGFAGLRIKETGVFFRPQLPKQWDSYSFKIQYQGRTLHIELDQKQMSICLLSGDPVEVNVWDKKYIVTIQSGVHLPL